MGSQRLFRKVLPATKPGSKRRSASNLQNTVKVGRVAKVDFKAVFRPLREFTPEKLEEARYLANIVPGQQRRDEKLLQEMRKKRLPSTNQAAGPATLTPSPSPPPVTTVHTGPVPAPIKPQPAKAANWEEEAAEVIRKKGWSLDKVLSRSTWKNKVNNDQRLKLLKDDGYDITPLQTKGTTADQIITALLTHIDSRKQQIDKSAIPATPATDEDEPFPSTKKDHATQHMTGEQDKKVKERRQWNSEEDGSLGDLEDEPLSVTLERLPRIITSLVPQKRKHTHEDDDQPEWLEGDKSTPVQSHDTPAAHTSVPISCACGPPGRKMRVSTSEELQKETEKGAFDLFKKNLTRNIFRSSQGAQKVSTSHKTPSTKPSTDASRVIFMSPDPSPNKRATPDLYIGSRGFATIMDEVKYLAQTQDEDGTMHIRNPDAPNDTGGNRSMETDDLHQDCICVSEDSQRRTIMQGDARALMGLMWRLSENELMHPSQWVFNGIEVVREGTYEWTLSTDTQTALEKIEKLLEAGQDDGDVEVRVEQIYNGKKLRIG